MDLPSFILAHDLISSPDPVREAGYGSGSQVSHSQQLKRMLQFLKQ